MFKHFSPSSHVTPTGCLAVQLDMRSQEEPQRDRHFDPHRDNRSPTMPLDREQKQPILLAKRSPCMIENVKPCTGLLSQEIETLHGYHAKRCILINRLEERWRREARAGRITSTTAHGRNRKLGELVKGEGKRPEQHGEGATMREAPRMRRWCAERTVR